MCSVARTRVCLHATCVSSHIPAGIAFGGFVRSSNVPSSMPPVHITGQQQEVWRAARIRWNALRNQAQLRSNALMSLLEVAGGNPVVLMWAPVALPNIVHMMQPPVRRNTRGKASTAKWLSARASRSRTHTHALHDELRTAQRTSLHPP